MASIRLLIPLLFSAQVTVAVGTMVFLGYTNWQKDLENQSATISLNKIRRVDRMVLNNLTMPEQVLGSMTNPFDRSPAVMDDLLKINQIKQLVTSSQSFWMAAIPNKTNLMQEVLFGSQQGEYLAISHKQNLRYLERILSGQPRLKEIYRVEPDGNLVLLQRSPTGFDPRQRPWYRLALKTKRSSWSSVTPNFENPQQLGIIAARPVFAKGGTRVIGVIGGLIALSKLSELLNIIVDQPSVSFIVEPGGELIATSTNEPLQSQESKSSYRRLRASESQNSLIRSAYLAVQPQLRSLAKEESLSLQVWINQDNCYVQVRRYRLMGVDWFAFVVTPAAGFKPDLKVDVPLILLLCSVLIVSALILGYFIARWLTRPLEQLTAMARIIEAETEASNEITSGVQKCSQRQDEFGQFARLFIIMEGNNRAKQARLKAQIQQLEIQIDQQKRQKQVKEITESEFFQSLKGRAQQLRTKAHSRQPGSAISGSSISADGEVAQ